MATREDPYLPDLEKVFSFKSPILSWSEAFSQLTSQANKLPGQRLQIFLTCERSSKLLSQPVPAFPAPSSLAQSDFETRTAAIHVTPSPKGYYRIEEIRDDTKWLSKEANIDQTEALRIVLLEWQNRPLSQLRSGFSEAEEASIKETFGNDVYETHFRYNTLEKPKSTTESQEERQLVLLSLFLQESSSLLSCACRLLALCVEFEPEPEFGSEHDDEAHNESALGILGFVATSKSRLEAFRTEANLQHSLDEVQSRLDDLDRGIRWPTMERLLDLQHVSKMRELDDIINQVMLSVTSRPSILGGAVILKWLQMMTNYDFFTKFQARTPEEYGLVQSLQSSVAITTVSFFSPAKSIAILLEEPTSAYSTVYDSKPYFLDMSAIGDIHEAVIQAASGLYPSASPAVLCWALILNTFFELSTTAKEAREASHVQHAIDRSNPPDTLSDRRSSSGSIPSMQQSIYEDIMENLRGTNFGDESVDYMLYGILNETQAFQVSTTLASFVSGALPGDSVKAQILQDLISTAFQHLNYSAEIFSAQLALLSNADDDGAPRSKQDPPLIDFGKKFMKDNFLLQRVFEVALARFPFETSPFLRICSCLASSQYFDDEGSQYIASRLRMIGSFTQSSSSNFSGYRTIREDENANLVCLDQELDMIPISEKKRLGDIEGQRLDDFLLPAGVMGEVISDNRPIVIRWYHRYSGLALLGKWLDLFRNGSDFIPHLQIESTDTLASEIIRLLSNLLRTTRNSKDAKISVKQEVDNAFGLLEDISQGLDRDTDITTVIFEIFEQQLHRLRYRSVGDQSLHVLVACLDYIVVVVDLDPARVWSALSRSGLIDMRGNSGEIVAIVSSIEASSETFDFLERISLLYESLREDSLRHSARRAFQPTGMPTHLMDKVFHALTSAMLEIFDLLPGWKFSSDVQRHRIVYNISDTMSLVVSQVYGYDDEIDLSTKLTSVLSTSAQIIIQALRPLNKGPADISPILRLLLESGIYMRMPWDAAPAHSMGIHIQALLSLCTILVQVGVLLKQQPSALESQLLNAFPIFVRLLTENNNCKVYSLDLMRHLLTAFNTGSSASLLGRLGSESSTSFLELLHGLERSPLDDSTFVRIWQLATTLVGSDQQWFAVMMLTGSSPHTQARTSSRSEGEVHGMRGGSFLQTALDDLSNIENLNLNRAIAMLEFVVRAQENWTWATSSLIGQSSIFNKLTKFVATLKDSENDPLLHSQHNKIASLVVDFAVIYLHQAKVSRDLSVVQKMIPMMAWLTTNAIVVDGYNTSLHANLRKNFSARYSGCSVDNFKTTSLLETQYGPNYFYDVDFAAMLLSNDQSWSRNGKNATQSFSHEFVRANLNLSLVDSQVMLLHSCKALCVEHCSFFVRDREVQKMTARIAQSCLQANTRICPNEKLFETVFQVRADFALAMLQCLVDTRAKGSDFTALLQSSWDAMRFRNGTYELAIMNNDLTYLRSTLSALSLAFHFHVEKRKTPKMPSHSISSLLEADGSTPIVLEVARLVLGEGVKTVVSTIHEQRARISNSIEATGSPVVGPKDLLLLLNLLQTILRLPNLQEIVSQMSQVMIATGISESCLLLYSWSHLLIPREFDGEPVYAELAVQFLVSLSSLPPVAEDLAVEGVLTRISTCRISRILRAGPDDTSSTQRRQSQVPHRIWTTGILPLCLNLLHSVGRAMSTEIATFLNQFSNLLVQSIAPFSVLSGGRGSRLEPITLGASKEMAIIALISFILHSYRTAGASAGVDAYEIPLLAAFDEHRKVLAEDIGELLKQKPQKLASLIVATNDKEAGWQKQRVEGTEGINLLEQKITTELHAAWVCLTAGEETGS